MEECCMLSLKNIINSLFLIMILIFSSHLYAAQKVNIPILCYHNFNPTKPGSMNLTLERLDSQLHWLKENGFTVIPLQQAVDYLQGKDVALPAKPIVITVDDGWKSAYIYMEPIVLKYNIPVTLFIYPQTISQGKNAMTWDELKTLQKTGLFTIQSHTLTHPNFKQDKRRLSADAYAKSVKRELVDSKKILEEKLNTKITLLAWPFGIYDSYLEQEAANAGYTMAFTIDYRTANKSYRPMAQPRFMMIQGQTMKTFESIVKEASG